MPQKTYEVPPMPPTNHGNTQAAWALSWLVMIGAVIAGVGMPLNMPMMIWAGSAIALVGVIAGAALKKSGKGQIRNPEPVPAIAEH